VMRTRQEEAVGTGKGGRREEQSKGRCWGRGQGGASAAIPAMQERVLLSLTRTGWCTIKPEIICKMEQEEMLCVPDSPGAQRRHWTAVPGGYWGGAWGGLEGSSSIVPLALDAPCPCAVR